MLRRMVGHGKQGGNPRTGDSLTEPRRVRRVGMGWVAGWSFVPSSWNRSKATVIAATLLLHLVLAAWLLTLRLSTPPVAVEIESLDWIPPLQPLLPPPPVQSHRHFRASRSRRRPYCCPFRSRFRPCRIFAQAQT